jgi:ABC-type polysaccharide/polyol phosphate transport system ATPase subunit
MIELINVNKSFKNKNEKFHALKNINLKINSGELVGVIGKNGSGKSTLLSLIMKILEPDSGKIIIKGKVAPILHLGTGFQPHLNALENTYLYSSILGEKIDKTQKKIDKIFSFAELEDFKNVKLKDYSSGMKIRLAFSIVFHSKFDILLLDEITSVTDISFKKKIFNSLKELQNKNKTILFVTHDLKNLKDFKRTICIHEGNIILDDETKKSIQFYKKLFES